jgi:hypothetical protein
VTDSITQSCFGYSITTEIDLRFTRTGATADQIDVVEMRGAEPQHEEPDLLQWLTPTGVAGRLFGGGSIFDFWAEHVGWFRIAPFDRTIEVPVGTDDAIRREAQLWGVPSMVTFTRQGDLSLHAAAIERNGRAVLVAAPGRHGKTTLALALHAAGCRLLTEDIARVQFQPAPAVLPGPAVVRARPDTAPTEVPAGMRMLTPHQSRVYLEIEEHLRGDSAPVPIAAIVLLRISEPPEVRLERADSAAAIRDMWALAFRIPATEDRARAFQQLADLTTAVPVYNFHRPLTFESLPDVVAQVMELCKS